MIDHGVVPLPPNAASYYAEDQPSLRTDLKPIVDHPARGPELHGRRQLDPLAEVAVPRSRSTRTKGWCCTRSPTTTAAGCARSCTARRSARWSCRTAIRANSRAGRTRSTRASGDSAGMTQSLALGCDCVGEIHYFDATLANEQGDPVGHRERDLHARGGLRDPLEARRPVGRAPRGAPEPAARRQLRLDRRQLRVRLLLVLLPRRQHPARGEAHRHRVADGDRSRHRPGVRDRRRARRRGAAPPAPVQCSSRLRRRRRR